MNESDYVCQRIHTGQQAPGDWILLNSFMVMGIIPTLYNVEMNTLKVEPKQ